MQVQNSGVNASLSRSHAIYPVSYGQPVTSLQHSEQQEHVISGSCTCDACSVPLLLWLVKLVLLLRVVVLLTIMLPKLSSGSNVVTPQSARTFEMLHTNGSRVPVKLLFCRFNDTLTTRQNKRERARERERVRKNKHGSEKIEPLQP